MDENSYRSLLDSQDWGDIHARLLDFASSRCGKRKKAQAKDLAQSAILRIYAFDSKWDPEREPILLKCLMSVVNSLLANERTSAAAQTNVMLSTPKERRAAERVVDAQAWGEKEAVENDLFARRLTLLRERMAEDPNVLEYLDGLARGEDSAEEVCQGTGWSKETFNAVRRRMLRAAALVARDVGGGDSEEGAGEEEEEEESACGLSAAERDHEESGAKEELM